MEGLCVCMCLCVCVVQRLRSGTTGVAVLIHGQELTVAWVGDTQVILVRKGQVVTLMDPHKPDRKVGRLHIYTEIMLPILTKTSPDANDNNDTHCPSVISLKYNNSFLLFDSLDYQSNIIFAMISVAVEKYR